jgi:hypothetical protein
MPDALAEYQRRRDAETAASYRLACTVGELNFPPDLAAVLAATAANPAASRRFLGVVAGFVPAAEFFAPKHLAGLLATAS